MKLYEYKNFITEPVIYGIYNFISDKWYIGSCDNFKLRIKRHYYYLCHNIHHSQKLQASWNKHGKENFDVSILKNCLGLSREEILKLEESYIQKYNSYIKGYNMTNICLNYKHFSLTKKQKEKASESRKIKVIGINRFTGKIINTYDSVTDAANSVNSTSSNISRCCKGKLRYIKDVVFVYESDYDKNKNYKTEHHCKNIPKSEEHKIKLRHNRKCKVLYKYDTDYNLIDSYFSRSEAERLNGFKKEGLRYKLDRNLNGFIYSENKYEKDIV